MKSVVDGYSPALESFIPEDIKNKRGLLEYRQALERVHFPG